MDRQAGQPAATDIAVIGLSGRFPGARNPGELWDNLSKGIESIRAFSAGDLQAAGIDPGLLTQPGYVNAKGVLDGVDLFDAPFFGFNPREAEITDPQHRILLECAWETLEDAGYDPQTCGVSIGVYAGCAMSTYLFNLYSNPQLANLIGQFQLMVANDKDHLTTRLAYKLNLRGPAVTVQTACSTSLVAVALACQSLVDFQCDMALAGGVSIQVPQEAGYFFQDGGIGSPDGHCRAFDASARGTVPGNGAGLVLLKRLAEAVADGDSIRAVIKGVALNNDGSSKIGYTAPSVDGQAEVIAMAQAMAAVEPDSISYIEAHGTGTSLGDPIEVAALTQVFRASTDQRQFCALGSLKTNIGHLDPAAGVAGLIKTILALEHRQIPASLNYRAPNPRIDFPGSPFYVNTALASWPANGGPRRAGVSSFGIGGTNAHVVLEEAAPRPPIEPVRRSAVLVLSARSAVALDQMTANLAAHLRRHPSIDTADVAWTLQCGRRHFAHRRVVVAPSGKPEAAAAALESLDATRVFTGVAPGGDSSVAFLFPGQGSQHVNMAREIYDREPVFREVVDRGAALLAPELGVDLRTLLYPDPARRQAAAERITHTSLAQPVLFLVEYALAKLLMDWGLRPAAMLGHSVGEYVAACLAGVMSFEDALGLVAARGRLMGKLPEGAMLAVALGERDVLPLLSADLSLAAVNAPSLTVVSGPKEDVARLESDLAARAIAAQRLHTSHAFHSVMMEPAVQPFRRQLDNIALSPPTVPVLSNVTGDWADAAITTAEYWAKQLRMPVRFAEAVRRLTDRPGLTLLEVGPGRTLTALARQSLVAADVGDCALPTLPHVTEGESTETVLQTALGRLWVRGAPIDWFAYQKHERRRRVSLPTYPFERQRYWVDRRSTPSAAAEAPRQAATARNDVADWFYVPSWRRANLPASERATAARPQTWLVLDSRSSLGAGIVRELRRASGDVVVVSSGAQFLRETERAYVVHPERRGDYAALLHELQQQGRVPDRIVHLWALDGPQPGSQSEGRPPEGRAYRSLIALAQALGGAGVKSRLHIDVISSDLYPVTGSEQLAVEESTLVGPCRVIPQEYPLASCRNIDLGGADARPEADVVSGLVAELAADPVDAVVAYRDGNRWIPAFERARGSRTTSSLLRERGTYIVTGGFGGIGSTLAMGLAKTLQARLVLVGRRTVPDRGQWDSWLTAHGEKDETSRRIRRIRALEESGAEVVAASADVADLGQMRQVFADATARFGGINGLVHAAGVAGGGLIQLKTLDASTRVMRPKVGGAKVIEQLIAGRQLDFVLLCSSLSALAGGVGQVDYCAANAYLDAFAARASARGTRVIAVDWDVWRDVGMAVTTNVPEALRVQRDASTRHGILQAEGLTAFKEILGLDRSRVIVSTRDLDVVLGRPDPEAPQAAAPAASPIEPAAHARPQMDVAYTAPRTEVEAAIAGVWQQLLGVDRVGVHDGFFDLGGHSLLAIQVVSRLSNAFEMELSIEALFDAPTVAGLAGIVEASRREIPGASADVDELLELVEGLSDAEVASLLEVQDQRLEERS